MLLLKRHLVELVRAGKKRQTIRLWSRPLLKANQVSYTPGLGKMRITQIDEIASLDELTDADAQADGFADRKSLLAEIHRIYGPSIPPGRRIYRIRFQWPADGEAPAPVEPPAQPQRPSASRPRRPSPRTMTRAQRQALHRFVLAQGPAR